MAGSVPGRALGDPGIGRLVGPNIPPRRPYPAGSGLRHDQGDVQADRQVQKPSQDEARPRRGLEQGHPRDGSQAEGRVQGDAVQGEGLGPSLRGTVVREGGAGRRPIEGPGHPVHEVEHREEHRAGTGEGEAEHRKPAGRDPQDLDGLAAPPVRKLAAPGPEYDVGHGGRTQDQAQGAQAHPDIPHVQAEIGDHHEAAAGLHEGGRYEVPDGPGKAGKIGLTTRQEAGRGRRLEGGGASRFRHGREYRLLRGLVPGPISSNLSGPVSEARPAQRFFLPRFCSTRNRTIRAIKSRGRGRSIGNWTEPFARLYPVSSASKAAIPSDPG